MKAFFASTPRGGFAVAITVLALAAVGLGAQALPTTEKVGVVPQGVVVMPSDACYTINQKEFKVEGKLKKRQPWIAKTMAMSAFHYLEKRLKCPPVLGPFGPYRLKGRAYEVDNVTWLEFTVVNSDKAKNPSGEVVVAKQEFKSESPLLLIDRALPQLDANLIAKWVKPLAKPRLKNKKVKTVQVNFQGYDAGQYIKVQEGRHRYDKSGNGKKILPATKPTVVKLTEDLKISTAGSPFMSRIEPNPFRPSRYRFQFVPGVKSLVTVDLGRFRPKKTATYRRRLHVYVEHDVAADKAAQGKLAGAAGSGVVANCVGVNPDDFLVAENAQKTYPWLTRTFAASVYQYMKESLNCLPPTKGYSSHKATGVAYVHNGKLRIDLGLVAFQNYKSGKEDITKVVESFPGESPLLLLDKALVGTMKFVPMQFKKTQSAPVSIALEKVNLNMRVSIANFGKEIYPKITYVKLENVAYKDVTEEIVLGEAEQVPFGLTKKRPYTAGSFATYKGFNQVIVNFIDPEKTPIHLVLGKFPAQATASRAVLPVFVDFRYESPGMWKLPYIKDDAAKLPPPAGLPPTAAGQTSGVNAPVPPAAGPASETIDGPPTAATPPPAISPAGSQPDAAQPPQ